MLGYKSPNEKLNIGAVGAGGKASSDIRGCSDQNIVALCDVDDKRAAAIYKQFDKPPKYKDWRKMLDKEQNNLDAVIVTVPDFMHAVIAYNCMERGKHVYVQKPLTRTIWEARLLTQAAQKFKVATQMGNQGYSNVGTRQVAEMVWAGEIGNVTEVHAWTNRPIWPQGLTEIPAPTPVPETLDWDLWLGIAKERPYTQGGAGYPAGYDNGNFYNPTNWRGFFDFGCGALGDMACHIMGAPNMALRLSERPPVSVECIKKEGASPFMFPKSSVIRLDFPALGSMPPLKVFWYDGMKEQPKIPGVPDGEWIGDMPRPSTPQGQGGRGQGGRGQGQGAGRGTRPAGPPPERTNETFKWEMIEALRENPPKTTSPNGSLLVGDKGMITCGTYGEYARLIPVERMKEYQFPAEVLTRSPGHYHDWIRAAKGGEAACSNFNVAGPFTEWIVMAVLSLRVEGKVEWDSKKMKITNNAQANQYLQPYVRKGWEKLFPKKLA